MSEPQPNLKLVSPDAVPEIPMFEGHPVHGSKVMISSTAGLDINNAVLRHNDIVRIVVEARVGDVLHKENNRGELQRVHVVKPLSVETVPWDPSDPSDNGVFRG